MSRSEDILVELREATREAAGVLKDLERVLKEARQLAERDIPDMVKEWTVKDIEAVQGRIIDAVKVSIREAETAIHSRFERIAKMIFDGPAKGLPNVEEITAALSTTMRIREALSEDDIPDATRQLFEMLVNPR